jgi:hypothetical protein
MPLTKQAMPSLYCDSIGIEDSSLLSGLQRFSGVRGKGARVSDAPASSRQARRPRGDVSGRFASPLLLIYR